MNIRTPRDSINRAGKTKIKSRERTRLRDGETKPKRKGDPHRIATDDFLQAATVADLGRGSTALRVALRLTHYSGLSDSKKRFYDTGALTAFPGQELLARDLGVTVNAIAIALKRLEIAELIRVTRMTGKVNYYSLRTPQHSLGGQPQDSDEETPQRSLGAPPNLRGENPPTDVGPNIPPSEGIRRGAPSGGENLARSGKSAAAPSGGADAARHRAKKKKKRARLADGVSRWGTTSERYQERLRQERLEARREQEPPRKRKRPRRNDDEPLVEPVLVPGESYRLAKWRRRSDGAVVDMRALTETERHNSVRHYPRKTVVKMQREIDEEAS